MWNDIIGHSRQIATLRKALDGERIPNAWLFAGMRGIGKRLVAQTVAASICCDGRGQSPSAIVPCGSCNGCRKVISGLHPDVFVVEPEKQTVRIDQIRELTQKVQFHPLEARAKIAIIDHADAMTEAASNALLKVLEEPPPATHFILVTSSSHRLLSTIRSRCQRVAFLPLPVEGVAAFLQKRENVQPGDAARIAKLSQGSLGLALELSPEFVDEVLGRFEAIASKGSAADIISTSESWAADTAKCAIILDLIAGWYRDRLKGASPRELDNLMEVVAARDAAETTANKQLMFEQLLFSVAGT